MGYIREANPGRLFATLNRSTTLLYETLANPRFIFLLSIATAIATSNTRYTVPIPDSMKVLILAKNPMT